MTSKQTRVVVLRDELEPTVTVEIFASKPSKIITLDINGPSQFVSVSLDFEKLKRAIEELSK